MNVQNIEQFAREGQGRGRRWRGRLKWIVSAVLLGIILFFADFRHVVQSMREVRINWLLAAACLQPVGSLLTGMRWRRLLAVQGVHIRLWFLFRSCIAANFFKQFMPSTIGGDPVRAYDSWRGGASKSIAVSTLVVDRLLGLVILALFVVVAMGLAGSAFLQIPLLPLWIGGLTAALAGVVWMIFAPPRSIRNLGSGFMTRVPGPLRRIGERVLHSVDAFRGKWRTLLVSLGLSILLQVNVVVFYYFIGRAMGFDIPLLLYFGIVPLATFVMLLPISINGIGVREAAFIALLGTASADVQADKAVAFAWLEYGIFLFHGVLGGVLYAATSSPSPLMTEQPTPDAEAMPEGALTTSSSAHGGGDI